MSETMNNQNNFKRANIFQVVKKSGATEVFNENKLQRSVESALNQAGIEKNLIASQLLDDIIKKLEEELSYRESISTMDIREAVEISLLERGLTKVASFYHDFSNDINDMDFSEIEAEEPAEDFRSDITIAEIIDKKKFTPVAPVADNNETELPVERESVTYKFNFADTSGYITVSLFPDHRPGEIVLHSLSSVAGLNLYKIRLFLEIINISLQHRVALNDLLPQILSLLAEAEEYQEDKEMMLLQHICEWLNERF